MFPENLSLIELNPFTPIDLVLNLSMACLCGMVVGMVYRWTYRGPSYSPTFVKSLVLLAMITAIVILVIGNSLARAFGLVGAMSIIRFRTAVRDMWDIVFIFFSLTVGMAAGTGMAMVALLGTLGVGLAVYGLTQFRFGTVQKQAYLLQIQYIGEDAQPAIAEILSRHGKSLRLLHLKSQELNGELEAHYHLNLRSATTAEQLLVELREVAGVRFANLLFDQEEHVGWE